MAGVKIENASCMTAVNCSFQRKNLFIQEATMIVTADTIFSSLSDRDQEYQLQRGGGIGVRVTESTTMKRLVDNSMLHTKIT
jgi:hypothetical protein